MDKYFNILRGKGDNGCRKKGSYLLQRSLESKNQYQSPYAEKEKEA